MDYISHEIRELHGIVSKSLGFQAWNCSFLITTKKLEMCWGEQTLAPHGELPRALHCSCCGPLACT